MRRAIASFTATVLLAAGCAPPPAPPREPPAHLLLAEAAPEPAPASAPAPTPAPTPTENGKTPPSEAYASQATPRVLGWFSIGIGAGAGIVAIGTSFMMLHQANVRGADCSGKTCSADGLNANTQLQGLAGWNLASYLVAAAGLGVGTVLLLTNPKNDTQTALEVSPNGAGAGLTLRRTF